MQRLHINRSRIPMLAAAIAVCTLSAAAIHAGASDVSEILPLEDGAYISVRYDTKKCPSGTAYVDLLVPMTEQSACYTAFTAGTEQITEAAEIARYTENGMMSLSLHHDCAGLPLLDIQNGICTEWFCFLQDTDSKAAVSWDIAAEYGTFCAAYVSAEGKVLGVTDSVQVKSVKQANYHFSLLGNRLQADVQQSDKQKHTVAMLLGAAAGIAAVLLTARLLVRIRSKRSDTK